MKYMVQFSGGVGSWAAAKRIQLRLIAENQPPENLVLLFADTKMEDEDLYRFLDEAAADVNGTLIKISDGRTPWELFKDKRFIGNTQIDLCSRVLKRELLNGWIQDNCDPADTTIVFGIDWTEEHRIKKTAEKLAPWLVEAPMCAEPYLTKQEMLALLAEAGIEVPKLYKLGFPHNNCGGFCVKAGMAQFWHLLEQIPERYAFHEQKEQELRDFLGKDVSILRDRRKGKTKIVTLKDFRERIERGETKWIDRFEWGGCGCALAEQEG